MPDANITVARGIDGSNIVGSYLDGSGIGHSFLYNGSSWTTLDVPGYVNDIDGSNMVGSDGASSFLYNGSSWTTLDMPGAHSTLAFSIDGNNIVGGYYDASNYYGFFYNGSSWTALAMPSASDTLAYSIDGSNIAGMYYDASGGRHGFVYTIPEPATILILGLGVVLLRKKVH